MRLASALQRRGTRRSVPDLLTAGIAVVVTALALVELFLVAGGLPVSWVLGALVLLPALALRRVRPLTSVLMAAAGFALPMDPPALGVAIPCLILLLLLASLGWRAPFRPGLVGVGVVLVAGLVRQIPTGTLSVGDALVNGVIIVGAWTAAFLLQRAQERRIASEVQADRAAREAVTAERARIARDLHDSMGHALTLITLQASGCAERAVDPDTRTLLTGIERTARTALTDLGRLLRLSGHEGDEALGVAALPDLVAEVRGRIPDVELHVDLPEVSTGLSTAVYRIVQEGLTNVVRHSAAERVVVTVGRDEAALQVEVWDSGPARTGNPGTGQGLLGLQERVRLLGGKLEAGPSGQGWRLTVRLPWVAP